MVVLRGEPGVDESTMSVGLHIYHNNHLIPLVTNQATTGMKPLRTGNKLRIQVDPEGMVTWSFNDVPFHSEQVALDVLGG